MERVFTCCSVYNEDGEADPSNLLKVVVVGDSGCGKTCLLHQFMYSKFLTGSYTPTIFEAENMAVSYQGEKIKLVMYDTAGQEDYDKLRTIAYQKNPHVVIVCFSVDNPDTLHSAWQKWRREVRYFCGKIPIILVGNKKDIRVTEDTSYHFRLCLGSTEASYTSVQHIPVAKAVVKYEEGLKVARKMDAIGFFETSAKTGAAITSLLEAVVQTGLAAKRKRTSGICRLKNKLRKSRNKSGS